MLLAMRALVLVPRNTPPPPPAARLSRRVLWITAGTGPGRGVEEDGAAATVCRPGLVGALVGDEHVVDDRGGARVAVQAAAGREAGSRWR